MLWLSDRLCLHFVVYRHVSLDNIKKIVLAMRPSRNALLLQALGIALKERRSELGLTQEDVAGAAEIDRPYVTLIESASKQPTVSVLWRLAAAVELTPEEFVARVDLRYRDVSAVAIKAGKVGSAKPR